ncbi:hypothetical protein [Enterovibrio norvegicus]|uniref:hypothetical protein n=1 Tax=Enterovibrio norvegicus TaxID=188144 RepID=UPI000C855AC0|nr:hypothetical protein [Enterovibrio norvegicus]PML77366.1 hypothetical protein BCT69_20230 [Enterovibrio norvegicus]
MNMTPIVLLFLLMAPIAEATDDSQYSGDKDDPTSVTSFAGMRAGTNGYGAIFQLGIKPEDSAFAHNSFLQLKDDFETVRLRHFSLYKGTGTGVFIDAEHNNSGLFDRNRASAGFIQIIPVNDQLRINPAILYGKTWTTDEKVKRFGFPDTDIATLYTFVRWQIADDWFLNLVPQYTYSTNGKKIRAFEMVTQLGHNINNETSIAINADEDDDFWLTIKHSL